MTIFIGDVHGKYNQYSKILKANKDTIQVGDLGVGLAANPPYDLMLEGNHRFIRGNHDNPDVCRRRSQYIRSGTVEDDTMFIGGALSIDRMYRTEGVDWWAEEELSTFTLNSLVGKYDLTKPKRMVTHDCPEEVKNLLEAMSGRGKIDFPSRTRQAFQSMFELHQPELWVFGHWHFSFDQEVNGTRFVCLNELEVKDL